MSDAAAAPVRYHVADQALARIVARAARSVPGVVALRADLQQALLGLAGTWIGTDPVPDELGTEGVTASVRGEHAEVRVTVVCRLGRSCRELARDVRATVAADVRAVTGLTATVQVTIADIELG